MTVLWSSITRECKGIGPFADYQSANTLPYILCACDTWPLIQTSFQ